MQYNICKESFDILALKPVSVNGKTISESDGFFSLKAMDQIHFMCSDCYMPHLFYVILPIP